MHTKRFPPRTPPTRPHLATAPKSNASFQGIGEALGEAVRLVVGLTGTLLRIEVHDPGHGFELKPPSDDPLRASGWGLVLVEELADRWGIDHHPRTRARDPAYTCHYHPRPGRRW